MARIRDRGTGIVGDANAPTPAAPETFERPPENGVYRGRLKVRHLPQAGAPGAPDGVAVDWQSMTKRSWTDRARKARAERRKKPA